MASSSHYKVASVAFGDLTFNDDNFAAVPMQASGVSIPGVGKTEYTLKKLDFYMYIIGMLVRI